MPASARQRSNCAELWQPRTFQPTALAIKRLCTPIGMYMPASGCGFTPCPSVVVNDQTVICIVVAEHTPTNPA
eukprot:6088385-Prymnesium_polylepis.1